LARLPRTSEQEKGGSDQSGKVGRGGGAADGIGGIGRGGARTGLQSGWGFRNYSIYDGPN